MHTCRPQSVFIIPHFPHLWFILGIIAQAPHIFFMAPRHAHMRNCTVCCLIFFCLLQPAVSSWLHIHSPTNTPCCALRVWLYPRWWMVYTQRQIKLCLIERTIIPLLIGSHKRVWILCLLFSLSLPLFHRSLDTPDTETHKPSKTVARATVPAGAGEKCILQGERGDHFFAWQISLILCLRCGLMCWSDESSSEDGK